MLGAAVLAASVIQSNYIDLAGERWNWTGGTTYFRWAGPAEPQKPVQTASPPRRPDPLPLLREASRLLRLAALRLDNSQQHGRIKDAEDSQPAINEALRLIADATKGR